MTDQPVDLLPISAQIGEAVGLAQMGTKSNLWTLRLAEEARRAI